MALQPRYGTPQPPGLPLQPRPRIITRPDWLPGTATTSANAATSTDLANGAGSWATPTNAQGAPDSTYAVWTIP